MHSTQENLTVVIFQVGEHLPLNSLLSPEDDVNAYRGNVLVVKCDPEGRVLNFGVDEETNLFELLSLGWLGS